MPVRVPAAARLLSRGRGRRHRVTVAYQFPGRRGGHGGRQADVPGGAEGGCYRSQGAPDRRGRGEIKLRHGEPRVPSPAGPSPGAGPLPIGGTAGGSALGPGRVAAGVPAAGCVATCAK